MGYTVTFYLEITEQRRRFLRHTHQINQRVDVLNENGTEVTHKAVAHIVVGRVAATQNQTLAVEHTALGIRHEVECHGILTAGIMHVVQPFGTDGNKLALVVGGTR